MVQVLPWGYLPDTTNEILFVSEKKALMAEADFRAMGIEVVTGSHYLCVFIGDQETDTEWPAEKV